MTVTSSDSSPGLAGSHRPQRPDTRPGVVFATLMRPDGGSGVQTHVRNFQDHLDRAGRASEFVNPFSARSPWLYPVFGLRKAIGPINSAAGVWWYRHWHEEFLVRALRSRPEQTDPGVLYAQCPVSASAALRARTGLPVVMAAHFNISQADEWANKGELPRDGRVFRSIRALEDRVLPRLAGIVYVSEFTRAALQDRVPALRAVPSVVVHNSVAAPPHREPTSLGDLVTVGALEPQKNHRYLLEVLAAAARRGHRPTLTVIGEGPLRGELEARAAALGLAGQVRFTGYLPDPRSVVAGHRLYCHSAVSESFGFAPLEAMAEGLPVLAAPVGALPELIRPGRDGMFWPLDDAATAAGILLTTTGDRPGLLRMGARAAERARTDFSAPVLGDRLLSFLDGIARSRSRA